MKRRDFIKQSGTITAGLYAFPTVIKNYQKERIRVGVIGTGDRGLGVAGVMQESDWFDVKGCCDVLPFRLDNARNRFERNASYYTDYRKMLENPDLDAILVATPLSMHHEMAIAALDAGKHVYCEKTMAFHIPEVQDMAAKVKDSDKTFLVGHQYRSVPLYYRVAEMIQEGYIGQVTNIYVQWNRNGNWRRPVPDPQYERMVNWRMYREYSGGLTAELHSHQIDFINYVFNSHPVRIMGMASIDYWKDGRETFDNVNNILEYPNGMKVNLISLTANARNDYLMEFRGSKGTIVLGMDEARVYPESEEVKQLTTVDGVTGATAQAIMRGEGIPVKVAHQEGWSNTTYALKNFYEAIVDQAKPYSTVVSGGTTAIVVRLIIDAMVDGEIKSWQPEYKLG